jgi:hypothetical protein
MDWLLVVAGIALVASLRLFWLWMRGPRPRAPRRRPHERHMQEALVQTLARTRLNSGTHRANCHAVARGKEAP